MRTTWTGGSFGVADDQDLDGIVRFDDVGLRIGDAEPRTGAGFVGRVAGWFALQEGGISVSDPTTLRVLDERLRPLGTSPLAIEAAVSGDVTRDLLVVEHLHSYDAAVVGRFQRRAPDGHALGDWIVLSVPSTARPHGWARPTEIAHVGDESVVVFTTTRGGAEAFAFGIGDDGTARWAQIVDFSPHTVDWPRVAATAGGFVVWGSTVDEGTKYVRGFAADGTPLGGVEVLPESARADWLPDSVGIASHGDETLAAYATANADRSLDLQVVHLAPDGRAIEAPHAVLHSDSYALRSIDLYWAGYSFAVLWGGQSGPDYSVYLLRLCVDPVARP